MFSVPRPRKAIPQIKNVPLTKEEIRRRKTIRRSIIAAIVLAALTTAFLLYRANHRREIESARWQAERTGRIAAIDHAIELLDGETGPADMALAARLHATAELAGAAGTHRELAEALLAHHDPSSSGASDHRIAETYLALAAGNADEAARQASLLVAGRGPSAAEAGHAVARAELAIGNVAQARMAADAARSALSDAPRHLALVVEIAARGGGEAPDARGSATVLRCARMRAAIEGLGESSGIRSEAQAVLDASDATPSERGWAELGLGIADAIDGDTLHASEHLHTASDHRPPGDEMFTIELAEALFDVGRRLEASRAMEPLTSPVSTDGSRRTLLTAHQAFLQGDIEASDRAAETATDSPRRTLVLARLADARGDPAGAERSFRAVEETPALASYAYFDLVQFLLTRGDAAGALEAIRGALDAQPTHPRIAAAAAYALGATGDHDGALTVLDRANAAHEGEPLILIARARVHARAGEWAQAYESFQAVTSATEGDAQLNSERGQAARMLGHLEEAREAYTAALLVEPHQATALVALLGVQVETGDLVGATQSLRLIDDAHLVATEIDHLRARALVDGQAGQSGVAQIEESVGRSPEDGELRVALARLYTQAERWSDAADAYYATLTRTPDRRLALGMRAIALARAHRDPTVTAMLDQLRATVSTDSPLAPRDNAMIDVASAWVEWEGGAYGRVSIFARQALDAVPGDPDATILLANVDENAHRDPSERLRTIASTSIEARGWLATLAATPLDEAGCVDARAYLVAAPRGRFADALGARVVTCPAQ